VISVSVSYFRPVCLFLLVCRLLSVLKKLNSNKIFSKFTSQFGLLEVQFTIWTFFSNVGALQAKVREENIISSWHVGVIV